MKNHKMICVPMDHGVSSGPLKGIRDMNDIIDKITRGGATTIVVNKGIIKSLQAPPKVGIIMHLSASTNLGLKPNTKVQIGSVEEAIRLGADAVSVHINIGGSDEDEMLSTLGTVSDDCDLWDMPLIAMMYPRGENVKNPSDPKIVAHVARLGAEMGADIIKTVYTGDQNSFKQVVESCPVPIVIAGGPKFETDIDALNLAFEAQQAGAKGVAFGRNIFQHDNPEKIVRALNLIIMHDKKVEEASEVLKNA